MVLHGAGSLTGKYARSPYQGRYCLGLLIMRILSRPRWPHFYGLEQPMKTLAAGDHRHIDASWSSSAHAMVA
jgi:hypothetical protein